VNMTVEGGLMLAESKLEGKNLSVGEIGERLAFAGAVGFVAGATGVGIVNIANRMVKLARLARATTTAAKLARAAIRVAGQSTVGSTTAAMTNAARQLNDTGTINLSKVGDSAKTGAMIGTVFGAAQQSVALLAQEAGSTTAAAQMANINNTAGRFVLG